jgi:uncharacterized protein YgiM (DUF1202 family)
MSGSVTDIVRVRTEPNTSADILGRLREGAGVQVVARNEDNSWWQIAYPNGSKRGWISAEYTSVKGNTASLPVISFATATAIPTPTLEPTPEPTLEPTDVAEAVSAQDAISPTADIPSIMLATPTPFSPASWLKSIFPFLP